MSTLNYSMLVIIYGTSLVINSFSGFGDIRVCLFTHFGKHFAVYGAEYTIA